MAGKLGGNLHEMIVDAIRFDAPRLLRAFDLPDGFFRVIADESRMLTVLGIADCREAGGRIPDVVFLDEFEHPAIVEVGRCRPDKWPGEAFIHVGFDGTVARIGDHHDDFTILLAWAVRRAVGDCLAGRDLVIPADGKLPDDVRAELIAYMTYAGAISASRSGT